MAKKSHINGKRGNSTGNSGEVREVSAIELMIEEGVKESRVDNSYSRKQMGKQRDAERSARREQSKLNRRKTAHNASRRSA